MFRAWLKTQASSPAPLHPPRRRSRSQEEHGRNARQYPPPPSSASAKNPPPCEDSAPRRRERRMIRDTLIRGFPCPCRRLVRAGAGGFTLALDAGIASVRTFLVRVFLYWSIEVASGRCASRWHSLGSRSPDVIHGLVLGHTRSALQLMARGRRTSGCAC